MAAGDPLFIDVTWGAGGGDPSTTDCTGSLCVCSTALNYCGLPSMLHLTCVDSSRDSIRNVLEKAKETGIRNILALRGDLPVDLTVRPKTSDFKYASDLVAFIREEYGDYFGICVAGYPNGHPDCDDFETDLMYLKKKVDAGADFIITQLFFEAKTFIHFVKRCREIGIECPIIPGVLPIQSYASIRHLMKLSKLRPPAAILEEIEKHKDDDVAIRKYGVSISVKLCREILESKAANGFHFYTLNREVAVKEILTELGMWNPKGVASKEMPWLTSANEKRSNEGIRPIFWSGRPKSYLMRTKDWDEFPNGRWGDPEYYLFRAPPSSDAAQRRAMWGDSLESFAEIGQIFCNFIQGKITRLPWSEEASLSSETKHIETQLMFLNTHGIFTTNSQPAVNGVPSTDPVYGWGEEEGYVYQKAYLEFFIAPDVFEKLMKIFANYRSIRYHALNRDGKMFTNDEGGSVNAVTWGAFPSKEIIQPTVVDPESFPIWKDEAFELWGEWRELYEKGSTARALIKEIRDTYFLVNVVDNDY
eukprot:CAMPEP_0206210342 /NCGR_PEP_ID=MMETSP0166-20121206/17479_1 /ASSEMBLY_ACC=CAM_ASM_000260 /TAXON_ID=95228 /ORGANISM="Vannella robusta, Strain DIVA3 518/3/11/1/6" /LENGTH=531 /DNA_ID=CAMNT_0053631975 /DNA_START=1 /DNA_END=1592 /DNA_ORIENTATION=+